MPVQIAVDHANKMVATVASGPIRYADVENHLAEERYLGGLPYKELIDARSAEIFFTPAEVRKVVALLQSLQGESRLGPTAVLVSDDVGYGVLRLLQVLVEDFLELRPFRGEKEARAWMGNKD